MQAARVRVGSLVYILTLISVHNYIRIFRISLGIKFRTRTKGGITDMGPWRLHMGGYMVFIAFLKNSGFEEEKSRRVQRYVVQRLECLVVR